MKRKKAHTTTKNTKSKSQAEKFELIVKRLEHAFAPKGAVVKHRDKVLDHSSGSMREVDATIKYKVGTTNILIAIECRDRVKQDDSNWIESLVTKCKNIRANKMIAVSSKPLGAPAMKMAKDYDIDVRRISELTESVIFKGYEFTHSKFHYRLHEGLVVNVFMPLKYQNEIQDFMFRIDAKTEKVIVSKIQNERFTPTEFCDILVNSPNGQRLMDEMNFKSVGESPIMNMNITFPEPVVYVETPYGNLDVGSLTVKVSKQIESIVNHPADKIFHYSNTENIIAEGIEFSFNDYQGNPHTLTLHIPEDKSKMVVSVFEDK